MGSFLKFKNIIEGKERFLLIAHEQPDGDCLGAMLAINEILRKQNKFVRMVCRDSIPKVFHFLPEIGEVQQDFLAGDFDAIILIDNGDSKRTGFPERLRFVDVPIINIDHHPKNDLWRMTNINLVNENVSSTCELVFNLFSKLNFSFDSKIATDLLLGIFTDTGGFQHNNTTNQTLSVVAELLSKGARLKEVSSNIANTKSVSTLKLWGVALSRLRSGFDNKIVYTVIRQEDIEKSGATEEEVSGLINLVNMTPESKIALLLYESRDGKIKGSLRTDNESVNLTILAKYLGGGGHKKASGFSLLGKIVKTESGWEVV